MIDYRLNLVTAPAIEPVTLTEAKDFLRITGTSEDDFITSLIVAARCSAESYTKRAFVTQTWQLLRDNWPIDNKKSEWWDGVKQLPTSYLNGNCSLVVPLPPLQSVTSIKTYDDEDNATIFDSSNYQVSTYSGDFAMEGRITVRSNGQGWPSFDRCVDGIEIQFVSGYGDTAADVPSQIKQAILNEISVLYESRGICESDMCSSVAKKLLAQFRIMKL